MKEGNKLIAEFMGLVKEDRYLSFETGRYCKKDNDGCYPDPMKVFIKDGRAVHTLFYSSDWNWLMPVVEKIEEVGYAVEIVQDSAIIYEHSSKGTLNCLVHVLSSNGKLEATYKAVIEFIKWYNENPPSFSLHLMTFFGGEPPLNVR